MGFSNSNLYIQLHMPFRAVRKHIGLLELILKDVQ